VGKFVCVEGRGEGGVGGWLSVFVLPIGHMVDSYVVRPQVVCVRSRLCVG